MGPAGLCGRPASRPCGRATVSAGAVGPLPSRPSPRCAGPPPMAPSPPREAGSAAGMAPAPLTTRREMLRRALAVAAASTLNPAGAAAAAVVTTQDVVAPSSSKAKGDVAASDVPSARPSHPDDPPTRVTATGRIIASEFRRARRRGHCPAGERSMQGEGGGLSPRASHAPS
eukprot:365424-Chlamydomonas_euryale.AAC.28